MNTVIIGLTGMNKFDKALLEPSRYCRLLIEKIFSCIVCKA